MSKKTIFSICIAIITWQLTSIAFTLPIKNFSYGSFSQKIEKASISLSHQLLLTRSASDSEANYESLVFVGDVLLARNVESIMHRKGSEYPFSGLSLQTLLKNPAIVGNFESSMATSHHTTPALMMQFSVNEMFLPALKTAGFTHLSLANNHSNDYGAEGYEHAKETLFKNGFSAFGHGAFTNSESISYVSTPKGNVALVGIHASEKEPDEESLKQILAEAERHSYLQIVYIHWGSEYSLVHNKVQEKIAGTLVASGADLIIGHHPHVVQDVDVIDGVVVFYSLGNYIFDQYFSSDVQEGLIVALDLSSDPQLNIVPVSSEGHLSQPALMKPDKHHFFLEKLARRSDSSLRTDIIKGIVPLYQMVATSTEMAIMMP